MKRLRLVWIVAVLLTSVTLFGRTTSFFDLSVGGGWSSLGYRMDNTLQPGLSAQQKGSYGFNAHIGYGIQFNRYIGVTIGADLARYGSKATLRGNAFWQGVTDTDGELYDHITAVSNWKDAQELYMVEVPLAIYLRFPVSPDVRLFAEVGAKLCLPVMSKGMYEGNLQHTGFYEPWMLTLSEVPSHGFYSSTMKSDYTLLTNKMTVAGFVKLGVEVPVDELRHVWFFGAICGTMHFTPAVNTDHTTPLGWRNDTYNAEQLAAHAFMNDYNPIYVTDITRGNVNPLALGVEIGFRFRFTHYSQHKRCMCEEE